MCGVEGVLLHYYLTISPVRGWDYLALIADPETMVIFSIAGISINGPLRDWNLCRLRLEKITLGRGRVHCCLKARRVAVDHKGLEVG